MSFLSKVVSKPPELIQSVRKLTLDEAFAMACKIGRPEIGSSFNGVQSAELKLNADHAKDHYISLKCSKYPTAAENLMELINIAAVIRDALR